MADREIKPSQNPVVELAQARMPFGKYKGRLLVHVPESYLVWLQRQGLPPGRIGQQIAEMLEIKTNGLEYLLRPLQESDDAPRARPAPRGRLPPGSAGHSKPAPDSSGPGKE